MFDHDLIGSHSESLCQFLLWRPHPIEGYLFRPVLLGEKWPDADLLVELIHRDEPKAFFFIQVKGTREGYTLRERRLKVKVSDRHIRGLAAYPAPTYLVGIDEAERIGYIISANGENVTGLSSMDTSSRLDEDTVRLRLWEEVRAYWAAPAFPKLVSAFTDKDWKQANESE